MWSHVLSFVLTANDSLNYSALIVF